jgi:hypothetical protein
MASVRVQIDSISPLREHAISSAASTNGEDIQFSEDQLIAFDELVKGVLAELLDIGSRDKAASKHESSVELGRKHLGNSKATLIYKQVECRISG